MVLSSQGGRVGRRQAFLCPRTRADAGRRAGEVTRPVGSRVVWPCLIDLGPLYCDADVAFVLQAVAPAHTVRGRLGDAFRADREIREGMLVSDLLADAVMQTEEPLLRVSPMLFFSMLVARVRRDLTSHRFTVEESGRHAAVVFDAGDALALLCKPHVFDYLILLLVSFVQVRTVTLAVADDRGRRRMLRFDTLDLDSMIQAAALAVEPERFSAYQRVADLCLFTIGVFPERIRAQGGRSAAVVRAEWIEHGSRFYRLASRHQTAHELQMENVLAELGSNFNLAAKPLNVLSDRYLWHGGRRTPFLQ